MMTGRRPPRKAAPIRVPVTLCACGALPDECDCPDLAAQMRTAPLIVIRRPR